MSRNEIHALFTIEIKGCPIALILSLTQAILSHMNPYRKEKSLCVIFSTHGPSCIHSWKSSVSLGIPSIMSALTKAKERKEENRNQV